VHARASDYSDCLRLGRALRQLRKEAGLTQERLAFVAQITKNYVSDVENGQRNPSYLVLVRWIAALGVDWRALALRLDSKTRMSK